MSYKFEIGCASAITNYEFRIMLARNTTSWFAPSKIEKLNLRSLIEWMLSAKLVHPN